MPHDSNREHFVAPDEFLAQMTSRQQWQRCDSHGATIRGLFEPTTGRCIFIEEERLFDAGSARK